jgi:uncharacterized Zn-finger protein
MREHNETMHKKEKCPYCSALFDKVELPIHKSTCKCQPKPCSFCGAIFELALLFEHEDGCGSRTEKCDICDRNIVLKEYYEHLILCAEAFEHVPEEDKKERPKRKPAPAQTKKRGKK